MAVLGLRARQQMLRDRMLKRRIEGLRAAIVRQGALYLLEPLLAFMSGQAHRRQLELLVRGIWWVGLQRSAWRREQRLAASIALPGRLDVPPKRVTHERIFDQMRTT